MRFPMKRLLVLFLVLLSLDACGQVKRSGRRVMGSGVGRVASSGTFTDSFDGSSLGPRWTSAGTWTVTGGVAYNTPTGTELVSNTGFELNTTGWSKFGSATVLSRSSIGYHSGSYSMRVIRGQYGTYAYSNTHTPSIGSWYTYSAWIKNITGSGGNNVTDGYSYGGNSVATSYFSRSEFTVQRTATDAMSLYLETTNAEGDSVLVDDCSVIRLLPTSLLATVSGNSSDFDIQVNVNTPIRYSPSGLVVSFVDTNNLVLAYCNQTNVVLKTCVGGTWSTLINAPITYVSGAPIRVVKSGSFYSMFYNAREEGSKQTIASSEIVSSTTNGIFSTSRMDSLDNFSISNNTKWFFTVGDSRTANAQAWRDSLSRIGTGYYELKPTLSNGGWTAEKVLDSLTAHMAKVNGTPSFVLVNIGLNDTTSRASYTAQLGRVLDSLHVRWPSALMGVMKVWGRAGSLPVHSDSVDSYIDSVLPSRPWTFNGPDERIWMKGSDNGATMTYDGTHYSAAGMIECARQWKLVLDAHR